MEVIRLWPEGPPTRIEGVGEEVEYAVKTGVAAGTTFLRNISDPTVTVFTPETANGNGAIVAPGGGWTINAWTHEGLDVANWLTGQGYTVFLLKYRVQASHPDQTKFEAMMAKFVGDLTGRLPVSKLPRAIADVIKLNTYLEAREAAADDGRRAIQIARGFGLQSLGMIGFSAGAFLAVDVALDPRAEPLAWIAPIYEGETRGKPIPDDAPPLFAAVARDDVLYKIVEGLYLEWSDADRPTELHVFAGGGHGFGMVEQGLPSDRWKDLFLNWLTAGATK